MPDTIRISFLLAAWLCACGPSDEMLAAQAKAVQAAADAEWNGPCRDHSTLVATTAGSPNGFSCWNVKHKMRVTPAVAHGEEIAALVFCECQP